MPDIGTALLGYFSQAANRGDPGRRSLFDMMTDPTGIEAARAKLAGNQAALSDYDLAYYNAANGGQPGIPAPAAAKPAAGLLGPALQPAPAGGLLNGQAPAQPQAQQAAPQSQGAFIMGPGELLQKAQMMARVPSMASTANSYLQMAETAMKEGKGVWQNPDGTTELRQYPGDSSVRQAQAQATATGTGMGQLPFDIAKMTEQNRLDMGKAKFQSGLDINKDLMTGTIEITMPDGSKRVVPKSALYAGGAGGAPNAGGPGLAASPSAANAAFMADSGKNMADYEKGLNDRVTAGADLMARIGEARDLLGKIRTGGGSSVREGLAQFAQGMNLPQGMVDKIAGGNLGASQEFAKLAVQQATEQLKQAMGGNRLAQMEFNVFQKNNPNLDTDPRAIEKIYNFQTGLYNRDLAEQDALSGYKTSGNDITQFPAYWQGELAKRGIVTPEQVTGISKATQTSDGPKVTLPPTQQRVPGKTVWVSPDGVRHLWSRDLQGNTGWRVIPGGN